MNWSITQLYLCLCVCRKNRHSFIRTRIENKQTRNPNKFSRIFFERHCNFPVRLFALKIARKACNLIIFQCEIRTNLVFRPNHYFPPFLRFVFNEFILIFIPKLLNFRKLTRTTRIQTLCRVSTFSIKELTLLTRASIIINEFRPTF